MWPGGRFRERGRWGVGWGARWGGGWAEMGGGGGVFHGCVYDVGGKKTLLLQLYFAMFSL